MNKPRTIHFSCMVSIAIAACIAGIAYGGEKPSYGDLLKRVKQYDRSVDFGALRLAYAATPEYNPYSFLPGRKTMFDALQGKKYTEALDAAQKVLDREYVDIDAHTVCKIAYRQMGNEEKAGYHAFVAGGLLDSILASGKISAQESAPAVISVNEEYVLMRALGLKPGKQKLIKEAGHSYDRLEVTDTKTGEELVLYFNVDIPLGWLDRQFKKPAEEKPVK